jgi:hypothetical protein
MATVLKVAVLSEGRRRQAVQDLRLFGSRFPSRRAKPYYAPEQVLCAMKFAYVRKQGLETVDETTILETVDGQGDNQRFQGCT